MKNGKLIVVEGACDGIGKTTQYTKLAEHLKVDNISISTHHFPSYNTYQGEPVVKYLDGQIGNKNELSPYFIHSLYAIDRAITWETELKKCYLDGQTILLDRYTTSSLIYQAALFNNLQEKKAFIDYICDFEYNKLGIKEPDNVIFLQAPFDLVTKMRNKRTSNEGLVNDIHESDLDYMKRVYENAMFVSEYLNWDKVNCASNDQMKGIDEIHQQIYKLVK